jgi:two-component system sensor histidine kinase DegS
VISASAGFSPQRDQNSKLLDDKRTRGHRVSAEHRGAAAYPPITHRLLAKRLFPGTRRRFLLRLTRSSPHLQKIQAAWKALLAELSLTPEAEKALCSLDVGRLYDYLRSGDLHAYEFELERLGQDLAGCDVPEEYAVAALGLFFEICLCGLLGEAQDKEYALGLARLASVSQLFLASGYAGHRSAGVHVLEDKLKRAEERAEALAISVSEANEKERRRLSSDLHDEIGHDLVVLKLYLELITADVTERVDAEVRKKLAEAISLSTRAIEAVRRLAFDLGPGIFEECGFVPAIRNYARHFTATTGVKAAVHVSSKVRLQPRDELALYRVLQGALSNVLKHSKAKTVAITVRSDATAAAMTVEDDGKGFNAARKLRDARASFGLQAMRERIELLGGNFKIHSPAVQSGKKRYGTRIEVSLPLAQAEAN